VQQRLRLSAAEAAESDCERSAWYGIRDGRRWVRGRTGIVVGVVVVDGGRK